MKVMFTFSDPTYTNASIDNREAHDSTFMRLLELMCGENANSHKGRGERIKQWGVQIFTIDLSTKQSRSW